MKTAFNDQFNYLLAFLAALIGLSAFRQDLTNLHIIIFNHWFTILSLVVPMVIGMLAAAYLAALAILIKNSRFTKFPLGRYLEIAASTLAGLGLLYPLAVLVMYLVFKAYLLLHNVSSIDLTSSQLQLLAIIPGLIQAVLLVRFSFYAAKSRSKRKLYENLIATELIYPTQPIREKTDKEPDQQLSGLRVLARYGLLVKKCRAYLAAQGYGVSTYNFHDISGVLHDKKIFDDTDLESIEEFKELKNFYNRGKNKLSRAQLNKMSGYLDELDRKITLKLDELLLATAE